ncbi:hypothetical protein NG99_15250 [Erwinia typographi]|uniref:Hemolysin XhlA n=1 Tax=Erwinia typographi TaxID=371042 RepID=A0A0A3Z2C9_9GAMM|nr:hypothetical protein [Erwinia typographi]KGT91919.1 hypothetical protein NG99_15250 [Erwinia typographi]
MEQRRGKIEGRYDVLQQDVSLLKQDVSILKEDVSVLKMDVAVIKSNYVTKEDLARVSRDIEGVRVELYNSLSQQTTKFVAWMFILLGAGLGVAKIIF